MSSDEVIFKVCNTLVLPGWILLIAAPRWKWTKKMIDSFILPFLLGVVYLVLIAINIWHAEGGFSTLQNVSLLFKNPAILLAGWIHYLAFDFFVGTWEVKDSHKNNVPHYAVVPCLILTFLFGPIGFVLYLVLKRFLKSKNIPKR